MWIESGRTMLWSGAEPICRNWATQHGTETTDRRWWSRRRTATGIEPRTCDDEFHVPSNYQILIHKAWFLVQNVQNMSVIGLSNMCRFVNENGWNWACLAVRISPRSLHEARFPLVQRSGYQLLQFGTGSRYPVIATSHYSLKAPKEIHMHWQTAETTWKAWYDTDLHKHINYENRNFGSR